MSFAFRKYVNTIATNFGVGYDFRSIMHLTKLAFSGNGQPTLQRLVNANDFLVSSEMTDSDKLRLMNMYCK